MKKIVFSAFFGNVLKPERISYLERLADVAQEQLQLVAFNTGGAITSSIKVVNAMRGRRPQVWRPRLVLTEYLKRQLPEQADSLLLQAKGESRLGAKRRKDYRRLIHLSNEFEFMLDNLKPDFVFLWNEFNIFHRIAAALLAKRGIKFGFFHDGVLPGSIVFDIDGEMGESWVSRNPDLFQSVNIAKAEISNAENFLAVATDKSLVRHPQIEHISVVGALKAKKLHDRPLIFFAGQNDWHGGIKPDGPSRQFHSPLYKGSIEALEELDDLAGELGLAILFKPHPLNRDKLTFLRNSYLQNSLVLSSTSIDSCMELAFAVMTIASQSAYVALMANKPVIMLGRNQLSGKGLVYEASSREQIKSTLIEALSDPLSRDRRKKLVEHLARLEKAYLFDFGTTKNTFYRRKEHSAARFILDCVNSPKEKVIEQACNGFYI